MAFRTKKISQMDPKGSNLASTDLLEISQLVSGSYVTKSITGAEIVASVPPSVTAWGTITGTLSSQTDLNTALSGKVPTTRTISTTSPLSGGGDLSADRTLSIATANTTTTGALSSTDWNTFNGKQSAISLTTTGTGAATFVSNVLNVPTPAAATFSSLTTTGSSGASTLTSGVLNVPTYSLSGLGGVPTTRTLTINGTTQDLSVDRTFTISTGITIGTTAIASGTVGRVLFEGTGNVVSESANLFWDNTNGRLGIGGTPSTFTLDVNGTARVSGVLTTPLGINLSGWYLYANGTSNASLFGGTNWVLDTVGGGGYRFRTAGNVDRLRIESNGNVLINTTTDAGYKLDVNGTARVVGSLQLDANTAITFGANIGRFTIDGSFIRFKAVNGGDMLNMTANFLGIFETSVVPSAVVSIASTTRGFLPPRMTTTQKNAIASPATGLMVYDTTLNKLCVYTTAWETVTSL